MKLNRKWVLVVSLVLSVAMATGGMENAKVVFTNNVVANFTHIEDTDIVKMNGTGITVTDEGNTWPAGKETITIVP